MELTHQDYIVHDHDIFLMSVQNTDFPLFPLCKLFFTSFMLRAGSIQAAESCSFSEKALRDYTLTPQPPPSLQDPRPRKSIDLGRYAFAYIHVYIPYSGFLSREKTFANFAFVAICESFLRENIF